MIGNLFKYHLAACPDTLLYASLDIHIFPGADFPADVLTDLAVFSRMDIASNAAMDHSILSGGYAAGFYIT